jgi:predicted kinase
MSLAARWAHPEGHLWRGIVETARGVFTILIEDESDQEVDEKEYSWQVFQGHWFKDKSIKLLTSGGALTLSKAKKAALMEVRKLSGHLGKNPHPVGLGTGAQGMSLAALARKVADFNRKIRREAARFRKPNRESLTAIFLMGIPAAGKSTLTRKRYGADARYLIIDPDEIAEKLPGYSPKDPQITHGEASRLAEEQWQGALRARDRNIIFDGTGTKAEKLVRRMKEAKAAGYSTKLLYVTIPLELALRRNQERPRTVPEHIVLEKAAQINETYETVKPFADSIEEVDTTKQGNPKLSRVQRRAAQFVAQGRSRAEVQALLAAEFPEVRIAQGLTPSVRKCPNCSEAVRFNGRRTVNGRRGVLIYDCVTCGKSYAQRRHLE